MGRSSAKLVRLAVALLAGAAAAAAQRPTLEMEFARFLPAPPSRIAVDGAGVIYVAGPTYSDALPTTPGALQPGYAAGDCPGPGGSPAPCADLFLGALEPDGSAFRYLTYLGGDRRETLADIAVGEDGALYVLGLTDSPSFPFDTQLEPQHPTTVERPFVARVSPDGGRLDFVTALPRPQDPFATLAYLALDADEAGRVVVAGAAHGDEFPLPRIGPPSADAGVYRSDDGGATWRYDNTGLTAEFGSFRFAAAAGETLYAATDHELFRKRGLADPWERLEDPATASPENALALAADPEHPEIVYRVTDRTIYRSDDGGATWEDVSFERPEEDPFFRAFAGPAAGIERLYATTRRRIFHNDSAGDKETWVASGDLPGSSAEAFFIHQIVVDTHNADRVYVVAQIDFEGGTALFGSPDGGDSWTELVRGRGRSVALDPFDALTLLFDGAEGALRSRDRGASWELLSRVVSADGMVGDPLRQGKWLAHGRPGRFGGEWYRSDDDGAVWNRTALELQDVGTFLFHPARPGVVYALGGVERSNALVLRLTGDGRALDLAAVFGGSSADHAADVTALSGDRIRLVGSTDSLDFPTTADAWASGLQGEADAFVAELDAVAGEILYASLVPGIRAAASATAPDDAVLLAGEGFGDAGATARVVRLANGGRTLDYDVGLPLIVEAVTGLAAAPHGRAYVTARETVRPSFRTVGALLGVRNDGYLESRTPAPLHAVPAAAGDGRPLVTGSGYIGVSPFVDFDSAAGGWAPGEGVIAKARPAVDGPALEAVVSAGGFTPRALSPGAVTTLFGRGLGPAGGAVWSPAAGSAPTKLGGLEVCIDAASAPLLYAVSGQANLVVPFSAASFSATSGGSVAVQAFRDGAASGVFYLPVAAAAPEPFRISSTRAAVLNQDGAPNTPGHPAAPGSIVQVFWTGGGAFAEPAADGSVTPLETPFPALANEVNAFVASARADVLYAGAAPGLVSGVLQLNLRVPLALEPTAGAELVIGVAGEFTQQPRPTIAVGP